MNSTAALSGSHLRTYQTIFQHPASHNLQWHDVHALFRHLGQVETETNGNLKVTRHAHTLVLPPARTKDVGATDELMILRHFLERSEAAPASAPSGLEAHWLLVIDHHEARIFRTEMAGAIPQRILPHPPGEHFRHEQNSQNLSRGKARPDPNSFFEPVAKALGAAGPVLLFGTGKGTSSEMEQFKAWTGIHHPELARRIIGAQTVDEHHLSEGQLLEKAREFYSAAK